MNLYTKQKQTWRYSPVAEHLTAGTGPKTEPGPSGCQRGKERGERNQERVVNREKVSMHKIDTQHGFTKHGGQYLLSCDN